VWFLSFRVLNWRFQEHMKLISPRRMNADRQLGLFHLGTSFLIRTKEKLKAYEALEFVFIGWEGKKTSVVRYEIRCRRLESTASEIWCCFFFSSYWKLFWSAALSTRQHCLEAGWEALVFCYVSSPALVCSIHNILGMVNNSVENWPVCCHLHTHEGTFLPEKV
jgi:hypothetical protein